MHRRPAMITLRLLVATLLATLAIGQRTNGQPAAQNWQSLSVPGYWEKSYGGTGGELDGYAWYRCFVSVPKSWQGQPLQLLLGNIDDCDETFVNGNKVGASGSLEPYRSATSTPRAYTLKADHVRFGQVNLIAVRVFDGGGAGGISKGPVALSTPDARIDLRGNWDFRPGDDLQWAKWPAPPESDAATRLVADFQQRAGNTFGREVTIDRAPLPGTKPLTQQGDLASQLVDGVDRFLLSQIDASVAQRVKHWKRDFTSPDAYNQSIKPNRERLAHILGIRDARVPFDAPEVIASPGQSGLVGRGKGYEVYAVRWPAFRDVEGAGLLLVPTGRAPLANVVALPDAAQTPEQLAGLSGGLPPQAQYARRLAESGCRVIVPVVINRETTHRQLTNREFLYRASFELGRHLIGYEVQKVLAAVDWFEKDAANAKTDNPNIAVVGWGEGGLLALYAAAVDPRIDAALVSGYFNDRNQLWQEPLDRNVFALFEQFGDAELATMVAPRALIVEAARGPELELPGKGGAPARLTTPDVAAVRQEVARAHQLLNRSMAKPIELVESGDGTGSFATPAALSRLLGRLAPDAALAADGGPPEPLGATVNAGKRHQAQMHQLDRHTQWVLRESPYVRNKFMSNLKFNSVEAYEKSVEPYRDFFREEVVGHFDLPRLAPNVRTRKAYDEPTWTGYEVVMDVFPDVIAYGILLLPKDLKPGERRPVVVCQHGLEGRPQHVITGDHGPYHDFATRLAERGFITFAPQNLYIFQDRFRTLQRKSYPLKKTLFSVIVPQHQQIVDWLARLPNVDPKRIAFYGLSYGGKTAMRVPPLVTDYCLSICSADFNEWVWKNASTRSRYSYVWSGEYEIFEWDLGSTFNYTEMAALIAPRPFMVERGHFDGVAPDEAVGYEFAKVRRHYAARLGLGERCEIEWFVGPHTINGKGTYAFLHKHLNWPEPKPDKPH